MQAIKLNKTNMLLNTVNSDASPATLKTVRKFEKMILADGDVGINNISILLKERPLKNLKVTTKEFAESDNKINDELKSAILIAYSNIKKYHESQLQQLKTSKVETTPGINLWSEFKPIDRVGLYIPGGSAPLFSSLLMQAIPALIAGCKDIVICTPPNKNGKIDPSILWVAKLLKTRQVFKVGGAQAIFAMSYGTKSVPKCLKIFGPGNQYVNEAKKLISVHTPIDMPAGPSEVYVVSDDISKSKIIAADLLSQLEHSPDAKAVFITKNKNLIEKVKQEISNQKNELNRKTILNQSLKNIIFVLANKDLQIIECINTNAPEHLILLDQDYIKYSAYILNAGSVFCGVFSPESFGDYASGSNHTLPTSGYAKSYSGLSVTDFGKIITFQTATAQGFNNLSNTVKILAMAEDLDAHANAVSARQSFADKAINEKQRSSFISRSTNETDIYINLNIDGTGQYNINTGLKFFDHMLEQFAKHGSFDISIQALGDLDIDEHHTIEDVAITLGDAFNKAIEKRSNIERYSSNETLVMDETLSIVSIDMASRTMLQMDYPVLKEYVGDFPTEMFEHFFISFVNTLGFTCHISTKGKNSHHIVEATFKSFTRALSKALKLNNSQILSTKGIL
jgi:histidinol dehydrogenase